MIGAEAQLTEQLNYLSTTRQNFEQSRLRNQRELIDIDYQIDRLTRDLARKQPLARDRRRHERADRRSRGRAHALPKLARARVEQQLQLDEEFGDNSAHAHERSARGAEQEASRSRARISSNLVIIGADRRASSRCSRRTSASRRPAGSASGKSTRSGRIQSVNAFVDEFYLSRVTIGQTRRGRHRRQALSSSTVSKVYPDVTRPAVRDRPAVHGRRAGADPPRPDRAHAARDRPAGRHARARERRVLRRHGRPMGIRRRRVRRLRGASARVRFGRRNPEGIEVLEGLRDGEQVITSSYESLETLRSDPVQRRFLSSVQQAARSSAGDNNDQAFRCHQALSHDGARDHGARRHRLRARQAASSSP